MRRLSAAERRTHLKSGGGTDNEKDSFWRCGGCRRGRAGCNRVEVPLL